MPTQRTKEAITWKITANLHDSRTLHQENSQLNKSDLPIGVYSPQDDMHLTSISKDGQIIDIRNSNSQNVILREIDRGVTIKTYSNAHEVHLMNISNHLDQAHDHIENSM